VAVELRSNDDHVVTNDDNEERPYIPNPEERYTDELVIGVVAPVGSGASTAASIIKEKFVEIYGYDTSSIVKMSDIIRSYSDKVNVDTSSNDPYAAISSLQQAGSSLREKFGPKFLSDMAISTISAGRPRQKTALGTDAPMVNRRHVTVIDSIKNPHEVTRLRSVYGQSFWLLGIFSNEQVRSQRLKSRFDKAEDIAKAIRIDEDEGHSYGQKVSKTMELADYFIRNSTDHIDNLEKSIIKFINIIMGIGINTPTVDERSMYAAAAAASRSACLSRQVGAVIVNADGEIIGTGTNDVPKFGGGLYDDMASHDSRCHMWKHKSCSNDQNKQILSYTIANSIEGVVDSLNKDKIAKVVSENIKNLIEYSRAVHAEMEAIVSVARSGGRGIVGSTLYTTTYPCHSCARHVVAAGIHKVVYIEPYAKSLALDLHDDAISVHEGDKDKVIFSQYEGVAPNNYLRIYKNGLDRKVKGRVLARKASEAVPLVREALDDFAVRELMSASKVKEIVDSFDPSVT